MKKRHLRLVSPREKCTKDNLFSVYLEKFINFIECISLTKNEKIYIIKDILIKLYRDYEQTTGNFDIPYFIKAEMRMSKIIQMRKVNYYYKRLKKFKNNNF